jgi:hypothetical protein
MGRGRREGGGKEERAERNKGAEPIARTANDTEYSQLGWCAGDKVVNHQLERSAVGVARLGPSPGLAVHFPRSAPRTPLHASSSLAPCWPWLDTLNEARLLTR